MTGEKNARVFLGKSREATRWRSMLRHYKEMTGPQAPLRERGALGLEGRKHVD